jgi:hypothetical protein
LLAEEELPDAIGRVQFTDGVERDVHQGDDGRQFVVDNAGLRVFGAWLVFYRSRGAAERLERLGARGGVEATLDPTTRICGTLDTRPAAILSQRP